MGTKVIFEKLSSSAKYIQSIKNSCPKVGIILGSGLGAFVENIQSPTIIPYKDIPHFHETTVEGHEGRLILGKIHNIEIVVLQGRIHAYEGHDMDEIVYSTRLLSTLGIQSLILTNAAGGINPDFSPGELILIDDHINLTGKNPLIGPNINELGPRFPDMTFAYDPKLKEIITSSAQKIGHNIKKGVYCALLGPTYETPAEIRMLKSIGSDMVGMSTVFECIAANHQGIKVAGLSCITNMAAGIENVKLKHEDIKIQALSAMDLFSKILMESIKNF